MAKVETPAVEPASIVESEARIETPAEIKAEVENPIEAEDYLLKYQYGKEIPLGSIGTNPQSGSKSEKMKLSLLAQPKVRILIPVESGSDPSVRLSVNLNGYRLDLPRNTYIEIPEQIAMTVMESQKQQIEALQPYRTDRKSDIREALS